MTLAEVIAVSFASGRLCSVWLVKNRSPRSIYCGARATAPLEPLVSPGRWTQPVLVSYEGTDRPSSYSSTLFLGVREHATTRRQVFEIVAPGRCCPADLTFFLALSRPFGRAPLPPEASHPVPFPLSSRRTLPAPSSASRGSNGSRGTEEEICDARCCPCWILLYGDRCSDASLAPPPRKQSSQSPCLRSFRRIRR